MKPGCSCAGYDLPQRMSATGGMLALAIRANTAGRRGANATSFEVVGRSIDAAGRVTPFQSRLWLQSWLMSNQVTTIDALHVGEVRSDADVPVELTVLSRRLEPPVIRGVHLRESSNRLSATWAMVPRAEATERPEAAQDRLLHLLLRASPTATAGARSTACRIELADGRAAEVRLSGTIAPRWTAQPEAAILRRGVTTALIRLRASYRSADEVVPEPATWVEDASLESLCQVTNGADGVRVTLRSDAAPPTSVTQGRLTIRCDALTTIELPVIVLPGAAP